MFKKIIKNSPYVKNLHQKIEGLQNELAKYKTWVEPGHFYSPNPDIKSIKEREVEIFSDARVEIATVNLNEVGQIEMLNNLKQYYPDIDFPEDKSEKSRYYYNNGAYSYGDAIFLNMMIRHIKPKRIIEIGSGHSSCVMLDTNEKFFNNSILCSFIEPYPELLESLIRKDDKDRIKIISKNLQEIDLDEFSKLEAGDILFVDSTHVSKIDSDVNYIFFKLLPSLKKGVVIHFHDIFYPFEYPKVWIYEGRSWTEDYLLRAFLQYNESFEIIAFLDYFQKFCKDSIHENFPLTEKNGGGGFWLKKVK